MAGEPKKRRTRAVRQQEALGFDVFGRLLQLARDADQAGDMVTLERIGFQILPYIRPRLQTQTLKAEITGEQVVRIVLGGES